jgi:preprotein translocase subunit SecD
MSLSFGAPWKRVVTAVVGLGAAVTLGGCSSGLDKPVAAPSAPSSSQAAIVPSSGQVVVMFTLDSASPAPDTLQRDLSIIKQRIAAEKLSDTTVSLGRDGRGLVVQGPAGLKDQLEMLGRAGVLDFRPVLATGDAASAPQGVSAALWQQFSALDCHQHASVSDSQPTAQIVACQNDGSQKYVLDATAVSGTSVTSAGAATGEGGIWLVNVTLDSRGAAQFAQVTSRLAGTGELFAITVDGVVYSAPTVQEAITDGKLQITGQFTQSTAQSLAALLQNGALPVALNVSSVSG